MPRNRRQVASDAAFALVELLIVLAVLAGVAAVCWPALGGLLAKSELQSAAKQLRAAMTRARLDAMDSGTVRQLRYQPGTGRFEVAPLASPAGEGDVGGPVENTLPTAVRFEETDVGYDSAGSRAARGEDGWSARLWFFPSGRTSSATIRLHGRRDYTVPLSLRGITGTVTIGKVEQAEESS